MAQTFGDSEFRDIDRSIRLKQKWGKGKGMTPAESNYKNAISCVNTARAKSMDLMKFKTMYGEGGLRDAYQKLVGGGTATRVRATNEEGDDVEAKLQPTQVAHTDVIAGMQPELQAVEGELLKLSTDLSTHPESEAILQEFVEEFNDLMVRTRLSMDIMQDGEHVETPKAAPTQVQAAH